MKTLVLAILCVLCLVSLALADIGAVQVQLQGSTQSQSSFGGFSVSGQSYSTGQAQTYGIYKFGNPGGVATGTTAIQTEGTQFKFGSGFQNQNTVNGSLNGGGLLY